MSNNMNIEQRVANWYGFEFTNIEGNNDGKSFTIS
jgi:hypothetical protein